MWHIVYISTDIIHMYPEVDDFFSRYKLGQTIKCIVP